jgi:DNA polymerase-3 subunit gamma/tau
MCCARLQNALASGRVHHAFLFAGTRGVGKTTVARILAKCLNCECGVSATPCGQCASCREIDAGRSVDVIEVDAASRTRWTIRVNCWITCSTRRPAAATRST